MIVCLVTHVVVCVAMVYEYSSLLQVAMATALPHPPHYQPKPRYAHCSALVGGKWIAYGGHFGADGCADPPTSIEVYDTKNESWQQMSTSGTPPPGVVGAGCAAVGQKLWHIGGVYDYDYFSDIYCLEVKGSSWVKLHPKNPEAAPMMKGGMAVISHQKMIISVGGYGCLPSVKHEGVQYTAHPHREGYGWTNEVVCYDTEQSEYVCAPSVVHVLHCARYGNDDNYYYCNVILNSFNVKVRVLHYISVLLLIRLVAQTNNYWHSTTSLQEHVSNQSGQSSSSHVWGTWQG